MFLLQKSGCSDDSQQSIWVVSRPWSCRGYGCINLITSVSYQAIAYIHRGIKNSRTARKLYPLDVSPSAQTARAIAISAKLLEALENPIGPTPIIGPVTKSLIPLNRKAIIESPINMMLRLLAMFSKFLSIFPPLFKLSWVSLYLNANKQDLTFKYIV